MPDAEAKSLEYEQKQMAIPMIKKDKELCDVFSPSHKQTHADEDFYQSIFPENSVTYKSNVGMTDIYNEGKPRQVFDIYFYDDTYYFTTSFIVIPATLNQIDELKCAFDQSCTVDHAFPPFQKYLWEDDFIKKHPGTKIIKAEDFDNPLDDEVHDLDIKNYKGITYFFAYRRDSSLAFVGKANGNKLETLCTYRSTVKN